MTASAVSLRDMFFDILLGALLALSPLAAVCQSNQARSSAEPEALPTGMSITPTAASGSSMQALNPDLPDLPQFTADHPVSMAVSPDGKTLLVLTSGFNQNNDSKGAKAPALSNEYVFVYDISHPNPVKKQALKVANTFVGLAWHPDGKEVYA